MKNKNMLFAVAASLLLYSCGQADAPPPDPAEARLQLEKLERQWLEHEFKLDTAFVSGLLDEAFISINDDDTSNKQNELAGVYAKMAGQQRDSIFVDSFQFEAPFIANVQGNFAVVIFTVHSYKKDHGKPVERRTRFHDTWIYRGGSWKALSSQATPLTAP